MLEASREANTCNRHKLESGLRAAKPLWNVHFAPSISSTMDVVSWCRRSGVTPQPGVALFAGVQHGGVGQHGSWESTAGDVKLTVILPRAADEASFARMNCAAALATVRTLNELLVENDVFGPLSPRILIKLLNDVLIDDRLGNVSKISGSLGLGTFNPTVRDEHAAKYNFSFPDEFTILGIGVNLVKPRTPPDKPRIPVTSFQETTGIVVSRDETVGMLLRHLSNALKEAESSPLAFDKAVSDQLALGPDRAGVVTRKNQSEIKGLVIGVNGAVLKLLTGDSLVEVPLSDIERVMPGVA